MRKQLKKYTVALTPNFAKQFSDLPTLPGDRDREGPKGRQRVEYLYSQLLDGKFHGPDWATVTVGGVTYRCNGGNSSLMLANCNGEFPHGLEASVTEFSCDTMMEAADLFNEFDNQLSSRTKPEQTNANARIYSELDSISTRTITAAVNGIALAISLTEDIRISHNDRLRLIHSHQEFIVWSSQFVARRAMERAGTVGAMFLTFKKDKEAATQFWKMVVEESHPSNIHPTRKLAMFLRESTAAGNKKKSAWSPKAFLVKSIHAWNAHRRNQPTGLHFQTDAGVPALA